MLAEIIAVGDELLLGDVGNGNAQYISQKLSSIGAEVGYHTTVGDKVPAISEVIRTAVTRAGVVVMTGGLGPTHDDLTRQAIAEATGRSLRFHPELEHELRRRHEGGVRTMPEINLQQAYLPEGASAIPNPLGTAPGISLQHEGAHIFALPGVPGEMVVMLDDEVINAVKSLLTGDVRISHTLKVTGISEAELAEKIASTVKAVEASGTTGLALLPDPLLGEIKIRIDARGRNHHVAYINAFQVESRLRHTLGNLIFGVQDATLESVVADECKQRNRTLAVAESFTGGALISRLISVPDASEFLTAGYVTYSLDAKQRDLGVASEILERHGAVSGQTARAMAEGARRRGGADLGISTTGEAGPDPAEEPVGTIYVGLAWDGGSAAQRFFTTGDRNHIRSWGTQAALNYLRLWLLGEPDLEEV